MTASCFMQAAVTSAYVSQDNHK